MMKGSFVKVLVVMFPLCLFGMALVGFFLINERRQDQQEETPMSQPVTEAALVAHYKKLESYMSPRGFDTPQALERLQRTGAYVEGCLSYMNTGLNVDRQKALTKAGRVWQSYSHHHKGKARGENNVIRVNYQECSNVELAAALTLAEALPKAELKYDLVIVFSPAGETTLSEWVREALSGSDNALDYDGVRWSVVEKHLKQHLAALSY